MRECYVGNIFRDVALLTQFDCGVIFVTDID